MRISDIFRQNTSEELKRGQDSQSVERARSVGEGGAGAGKEGEDTVSISALSRKLNQISRILADDEVARQERVTALKQQVESGEYAVSGEDVAQSLLDYMGDRVVND
jgi:negative regulator of flagellin synthesis FlgM